MPPTPQNFASMVSEHDCLFLGIRKCKHVKVKFWVDESVAQLKWKIPYRYQDKVKEELQKLEQGGWWREFPTVEDVFQELNGMGDSPSVT